MDNSALLFGRDRDVSARLLGVSGLLFVATFVAHSPASAFAVSLPVSLDFGMLFFLMLVAPTLAAGYNEGALVSLALALGPALGYFVPLSYYGLSEPNPSVYGAFGIAITVALTMGACGFLAGYIGRRVLDDYR